MTAPAAAAPRAGAEDAAPFLPAFGRLAARGRALRGWRRLVVALLLGAAAALALPPWHLLPLLVVGFAGLVWLLDGAEGRGAGFRIGWAFGLGFFAVGIHWIGHSFSIRSEALAPLAPLAIGGLAAGLAIFIGLAGWLQVALDRVALARHGRRLGVARVATLATCWTALEGLRGTILTGFPWNLAAYVWPLDWGPGQAVAQSAALFGPYGLSFLTVAIAATPAVLADPAPGRAPLRALAAAALVLGVMAAGGATRLGLATPELVPGVGLRIVQANISQREKWRGDLQARNLALYTELSRRPGLDTRTVTIWPETAATIFGVRGWSPAHMLALAEAVTPPGGLFITGQVRREVEPDRPYRIWNGLVALDETAATRGQYDKAHLVPFGEYMPLRGILPFEKFTPGATDYTPGPGLATLDLPGLPPMTPLICYEIIFPGSVVGPALGDGRRPEWLLNLTNDAWFGLSAGPHQHLAIARFRAIERGLPVVRAANTGISGVIDPWGGLNHRLDLDTQGVLDAGLPRALPGGTPFGWMGAGLAMVLCLAAIAARLWSRAAP